MVPCKSCQLLHSPMIRCEVAKRMLEKAEGLKASGGICEVPPVKQTVPERVVVEEKGVFKCPVCEARREKEAAYQREYMRVWRKKK